MSSEGKDYKLYFKSAHFKRCNALEKNPNMRSTNFDGKVRKRQDFDTRKIQKSSY